MTALLSTPDRINAGDDEWGPSAPLLPGEQANLDTFAKVFPQWNSQNVEGIVAHYDEDITWHNMAMGEVYQGKDAVRAFLRGLFTALPDLKLEIDIRLPRGRFIAEQYTISGTHLGVFNGLPPTGRPVEVKAVSMVELRDGKLLQDYFYFDVTGVLHQMGLFPPLTVARNPLVAGVLKAFVGVKKLVGRRSPRA